MRNHNDRLRPRVPLQRYLSNILYAFFWVIPRRLNFIRRRFGIIIIFIQLQLGFHPVAVVLKTRIQGYLKIRIQGT